ncbi:MAG: dihydrofolate reductase family protein [Pyrinomonadaceae bacterium]
MRKVIFGGANSLDNFIARKDGGVDWILWGDETTELMKEMWAKFDCMVMGRKTYDFAMQMGEGEAKEKTNSKGKKKKAKNPYGNLKTYVFSRTLEAGERDGVEIVAEDAGDFVRKLKKQEGGDICVMGGGELGKSLLEAGVIDEVGFNIHPVLLGSGIPLFHEMKRQIDLELTECRQFKNGTVYLLYRVKN